MKLIDRDEYLQKLINVIGTPDIKVITGVRRSGKSKLLEAFKQYVTNNVANANINAAQSDFNGIVNVASGKRITINQLYSIVKKTLNTNTEVEYLEERPGDIKHSQADISNLKNINLQINTKNFEKQLIETINWFKQELI